MRVIEEFLRNHYLKSFGYVKKRLDDVKLSGKFSTSSKLSKSAGGATEQTEYEEYYYDEEENENEE